METSALREVAETTQREVRRLTAALGTTLQLEAGLAAEAAEAEEGGDTAAALRELESRQVRQITGMGSSIIRLHARWNPF